MKPRLAGGPAQAGGNSDIDISRRMFLQTCAIAPMASMAVASPGALAQAAADMRPTPACGNDDHPTPRQTEGPFYKPLSPKRATLLEAGIAGHKLVITGLVVSTRCRPLQGVVLDFWQADSEGHYDNTGFKLRGHQLTDTLGRYRLETILPGSYPGRTRHVHVKVAAPGQRVLTTQLYFPGEARNAADALFDSRLQVYVDRSLDRPARFDFVLNA